MKIVGKLKMVKAIYTQDNKFIDQVEFSEIMEFAKNNPMDWTGL